MRRVAALEAAGGDPIATGHTATDRAETVLYRLATSGGVNALPALPAAAPPFYRPLLDLTRDDVREELARRGLEWREDASNDDPAFARNRIRNEALPVLLALNPRADANIARTAEVAAAERELLAALAAPFVADGAADLAVPRRARGAAARGRPPGRRGGRGDRAARRRRGADRARRRQPAHAAGRRRGRDGWRLAQIRAPKLESPAMSGIDPGGLVAETLIDGETLQARVAELGAQITSDYADDPPLLVCVLKGAFMFVGDLVRAIDLPVEVDFMAISSYGSGTQTSGIVRIVKDLEISIEGRAVIVVEDIVDSGLTLSYLLKSLQARRPRSLAICALLTKPERREVDVPVTYVGFEIANKFVVGYGLDIEERFRNLDYIGVVATPDDHSRPLP